MVDSERSDDPVYMKIVDLRISATLMGFNPHDIDKQKVSDQLRWAADTIEKYEELLESVRDVATEFYKIGEGCMRCNWDEDQPLWCTCNETITSAKLLALKPLTSKSLISKPQVKSEAPHPGQTDPGYPVGSMWTLSATKWITKRPLTTRELGVDYTGTSTE